eukprot:TRINITY_DN20985_c0_g1_i2.p6 TRINITY_DN20985_c0_g1~~TRINITY_DN20985_c0_g1_i2.p6  ORF type:complete len:123 (-),score=10.79 TRINITY_DN20985_c0_g1_i2:152-520(-)
MRNLVPGRADADVWVEPQKARVVILMGVVAVGGSARRLWLGEVVVVVGVVVGLVCKGGTVVFGSVVCGMVVAVVVGMAAEVLWVGLGGCFVGGGRMDIGGRGAGIGVVVVVAVVAVGFGSCG